MSDELTAEKAQWLEPFTGRPAVRPYCVRCEVPIYQDEHGVWRREATASSVCPRCAGRSRPHEPLIAMPTFPPGQPSPDLPPVQDEASDEGRGA